MPVPGERPICHYSGERCKYEGQACTCLLPGFTGTPPTWASDTLRAKLDKCDGLKQADKEYLLRIACAGIEYASEMQATRGVKGAAPTLPHPALDRANAGERESESRLLKQVLDALRVGRVACEWVGKPDEADKIAAAFDAARALALPAADHERREGAEGVALPDAIEKLRRCTLGCGVFGQCKATMHGKPSECAGGVPIPHTFAPPDADTDDSMEGGKK